MTNWQWINQRVNQSKSINQFINQIQSISQSNQPSQLISQSINLNQSVHQSIHQSLNQQHPSRQLYWSEHGDDSHAPRIARSDLAGQSEETFTSRQMTKPMGVHVDIKERRYFNVLLLFTETTNVMLESSIAHIQTMSFTIWNSEHMYSFHVTHKYNQQWTCVQFSYHTHKCNHTTAISVQIQVHSYVVPYTFTYLNTSH